MQVDKLQVKCLIDTGSVVTTMSMGYYKKNCSHIPLQDVKKIYNEFQLTGASGHEINIKGFIEVEVMYPGLRTPIMALMLVTEETEFTKSCPIIVGTNLIDEGKREALKNGLDIQRQPGGWGMAYNSREIESSKVGLVKNGRSSQYIPGGTEQNIYVTAHMKPSMRERHVILTPVTQIHTKTTLEFIPTLHIIPVSRRSVSIPVRVRNSEDITQVIPPRVPLYNMDLIEYTENLKTNEDVEMTKEELEFLNQFKWDDMEITDQQKNQLKQVLLTYQDIFAKDDTDLGECDIEEHGIKLDDYTPFKERYRKIPPMWYEEIKQMLSNMVKAGVIKESYSPWTSPITIAKKKDGRLRLCVDYRRLNQRTKKDAKSLPRIDDMMDTLAGAKIFSLIDMMSGYWQTKMRTEDVEYTAFTAGPLGFWEFLKMPFGLCNSGATFQRMMEKVLKQLLHEECMVYIDDVVIFSTDFKTHLERLTRVFNRLRQHNLKLKAKKCIFARSKITYLGHQVSADGIAKDPEKTKSVDSWETPKNVKELRRFLGFTGYFRRFIPDYSLKAKPLTDLLKGYSNKRSKKRQNQRLQEELWIWGSEQEEAFNILKSELKSDIQLAYADFKLPFILEVDASRDGFGAILCQIQDGKKRPIAFGSKRTSTAEQNYPVHKQEFAALKWAITDKFKDYLHCKEFTVYTDNNPVTYVLKTAKLDATAQRWCAELANYTFDIKYRAGMKNRAADALSRQFDHKDIVEEEHIKWAKQFDITVEEPVLKEVLVAESKHDDRTLNQLLFQTVIQEENEVLDAYLLGSQVTNMMTTEDNIVDNEKLLYVNNVETIKSMTMKDWRYAQGNDKDIGRVLKLVETNTLLDIRELRQESQVVRKLLKERKKLVVRNGVLHRKRDVTGAIQYQVVTPQSHHELIMYMMHEKSGHLGEDRTIENIQTRFYWPGMRQTIRSRISSCERCMKRKTLPVNNRTTLGKLFDTTRPFQRVSIDFLTVDFRRDSKYKILTVVDEFTRYGFALDVTTEQATSTAKTLYRQVFSRFGFPEQLHSDQGKSFTSKVMREVCELAKVQQSTTVAYNPRGNSKCERLNQTILNLLGTLTSEQKRNWKDYLPSIMFAYNTTIHESTDFTPFYLMFGRNPRLPIDEILDLHHEEKIDETPVTYAKMLKDNLKNAYKKCIDRMKSQQLRHKQIYDGKIRYNIEDLKPGDVVLVQKVRRMSKIDDRWEDSPYEVIQQSNKQIPVYRVKNLVDGKVRTLHRNFLQPFYKVMETGKQYEDKNRECMKIEDIDNWTQYVRKHELEPHCGSTSETFDKSISERVSLWQGDVTKVVADVVVVIKESLKKKTLLKENQTQDTGKTNEIKIIKSDTLSAKLVIQVEELTIEGKEELKRVLSDVLKKINQRDIKTIAIPCFVNRKRCLTSEQTAAIVLQVVGKYLEKTQRIRRVVFCTQSSYQQKIYEKVMRLYFNTGQETDDSETSGEEAIQWEYVPSTNDVQVTEESEEEQSVTSSLSETGQGETESDENESDDANTMRYMPRRERKPPDRYGDWVYHQQRMKYKKRNELTNPHGMCIVL